MNVSKVVVLVLVLAGLCACAAKNYQGQRGPSCLGPVCLDTDAVGGALGGLGAVINEIPNDPGGSSSGGSSGSGGGSGSSGGGGYDGGGGWYGR